MDKKTTLTLFYLMIFGLVISSSMQAQQVKGAILDINDPVSWAYIRDVQTGKTTSINTDGRYTINAEGLNDITLEVFAEGYLSVRKKFTFSDQQDVDYDFRLVQDNTLDEIVMSANLKASLKSETATAIEVYPASFFEKNLNTNLFQALEMVNGVQPQLNCNVCNTGDIQINGMPGAYTMILIDGMPIISALSTVYGLQGIPLSMIKQIEVIKGPASSLYGSEAMGGIVNVITKDPANSPRFFASLSSSTWLENNIDLGATYKIKDNVSGMVGVNHYKYGLIKDQNHNGFTDVTLQNRTSVFNKLAMTGKNEKRSSLALRYLYEDRWGGETQWNSKTDRGSENVYAESIYTNRFEAIGMTELPTTEHILAQFSYVYHNQNSMYGAEPYFGTQQNVFAQLVWDHTYGKHDVTGGVALKYNYYNDNTVATGFYQDGVLVSNDPEKKFIPGVFIQDDWRISDKHLLLLGYRFDYDPVHHAIYSPRIAYKYSPTKSQSLRASFGTGFRAVNVFSEDHRSLNGNREVVFTEDLKPEKSINGNITYTRKFPTSWGVFEVDGNGFYSHFFNRILPDIDSDPTKIIYANLDGYAISRGLSLQTNFDFDFPLDIDLSATYMDVFSKQEGKKITGYLAPKWSFNGQVSYTFTNGIKIDLTSYYKGPMLLELVENDYRPNYSPGAFLMDVQVSKNLGSNFTAYVGVKNLFNTLPKQDVITRWWDPHGEPGNGVIPPDGRNDVVFEPNGYTYTSLLGIRGFFGINYTLY